MARALLVAALGAPLLAWSWMSLESGHDAGQATLVVVLAIAAALVRPRWARVAACLAALLVAGAIAFGVGHVWALPARMLSRFGNGFLEFYDYQVPFDPATHPRMHGVLLLALFAFTLAFALAVAARRPALAAMALVVGVGWPGTLLPGHDLLRGTMLLVAVLGTVVLLRHGPVRGLGAALVAGTLIVLAALAATSSPAFAKRAFLNWQHWDLYTKPAKPVDVSYVWNSDYGGLTFRGKPTTVMRVKAGPQAHYWRVSVLNTVQNGIWFEEVSPEPGNPPVPLGQPGLVPPRELRDGGWEKEHVTIEALRDKHLPGGSVPCSSHQVPASAASRTTRRGLRSPTTRCRAGTATTSGATRRARRRASSLPRSRSIPVRSSPRATSTARWSLASTRGCSAGLVVPPTCIT